MKRRKNENNDNKNCVCARKIKRSEGNELRKGRYFHFFLVRLCTESAENYLYLVWWRWRVVRDAPWIIMKNARKRLHFKGMFASDKKVENEFNDYFSEMRRRRRRQKVWSNFGDLKMINSALALAQSLDYVRAKKASVMGISVCSPHFFTWERNAYLFDVKLKWNAVAVEIPANSVQRSSRRNEAASRYSETERQAAAKTTADVRFHQIPQIETQPVKRRNIF